MLLAHELVFLVSVDCILNLFTKHLLFITSTRRPAGSIDTCLETTTSIDVVRLALFFFTRRELPFKKGDILLVLRRINDDWLEGEHEGMIGIFPFNHVELFPIEVTDQEEYSNDYDKEQDIEGEAIVKYDFIPEKTFELQLRKVS